MLLRQEIAMTLTRRVEPMGAMPRGYAVAWWLEREERALCLPIGLHVVASWLRARWLALKAWHDASVIERAYMRGYSAGQLHGREVGRRAGRTEAEREYGSLFRISAGLLDEKYPEAARYLRDVLESARREH